ncbi:MAG: hypothetical protein K9H49_10070, partial [Bacteroidales bacterium]|nr:hypothetical protein [Bacteroidales bacterium]MCF8389698.1 hypothetical protein [Bacteroidales bacterium]
MKKSIIFIILTLCISNYSNAQIVLPTVVNLFGDSLVLDQEYSQTHPTSIIASAYSYISMNAGFEYDAGDGCSLTASCIPIPFSIIDEENIVGGHPDTAISNLVGDDGVVGAIPAGLSVTPTGGAIYNVPIQCPPGINGMTPNISLTYNSKAGNGIAGWGWNINGISAISRTSKTFYEDGEVDDIQWDKWDALTLDGQRLVYVSEEGFDRIFRFENNSSAKIIQRNFEDDETYFEVYYGDGKKFEYTKKYIIATLNSTIECRYHEYYNEDGIVFDPGTVVYTHNVTGEENVLAWYLEKITDPYNNYILFDYSNRQSTNSYSYFVRDSVEIPEENKLYKIYGSDTYTNYFTPELISVQYGHDYTGQIIPLGESPLDEFYRIDFQYESRPDMIQPYISGRKQSIDRRLKEININYDSINTISNYTLNYEVDTYSYLKDIKLSGLNGSHYNKTVFDWENPDYSYSQQTEYSYPHQYPDIAQDFYDDGYTIITKDFYPVNLNKDNLTDFFVVYELQKRIWTVPIIYESEYVWGAYLATTGTTLSFIGDGLLSEYGQFYFIDNNLNGETEIYFQEMENISGVNHLNLNCYRYFFDSGELESDSTMDVSFPLDLGFSGNYANMINADFDGDGATEFIALNYAYTFKGSSNFSTEISPDFPGLYHYKLIDFNGNGKTDILTVNYQLKILEYSNDQEDFVEILSDTSFTNSDLIYPGDFNGDGNSDLLFFDDSKTMWRIFLSDGKALIDSILFAPYLSTDIDASTYGNLLIADINEDGKSDILEIIPGTDDLKLYLASNTSFNTPITLSSNFPYELSHVSEANGGSAPEIYFNYNSIPAYFSIATGSNNSIEKITDGLGRETSLKFKNERYPYSTSRRNSDYCLGTLSFLPQVPVIDFMKVVQTVTNKQTTTSYNYDNVIVIPESNGRGLMGFGLIESENSIGDDTYTSKSIQLNTIVQKGSTNKFQLLPDTISSYVNDTKVRESISLYSTENLGGNDYILVEKSITKDLIQNTRVENYFENYNAYLSPQRYYKKIYQNGSTLVATDSIILDYEGILNSSRHIVGLPKTGTIYKKRPGETNTQLSSEYVYNLDGTVDQHYIEKTTNNEILTEYEYDEFGNVIEKSVEATSDPLIPSALKERISSISYTENGRFPDSIINNLGHIQSFSYEEDRGLLLSKTDVDNNLTSYLEYDDMGNLIRTINPMGVISQQGTRWSTDNIHTPGNSLFYNYSQTMGTVPVFAFMDEKGRTIRTVSTGFNGESIYYDKVFDLLGRDSIVYQPYFSDLSASLSTKLYFDTLGRTDSIVSPDGRSASFSYGERVTTSSVGKGNNKQNTITTVNALGEVICSEDNQGNKVNTTYNTKGLAREILMNSGPAKVEMTYDLFGNRTEIIDPNAGTIASLYNVFGQLVEQTDANNKQTEYEYDEIGRLTTESLGSNTKTYTYDETFTGALSTVSQTSPVNSVEYLYDDYGRLETKTENFDGKCIRNTYTYDYLNRLITSSYIDSINITLNHSYNQYGYLANISALGKSLWECEDMNQLGMITEYNQGSSVNEFTYDQFGYLETQSYAGGTRVFNYGFDDFMNLDYREDETNELKENFFYDELNRLTSSDYYENDLLITENLSLEYDENGMGNIISKAGVGATINYGENAGPNALTSIEDMDANYEPWPQTIAYTDFNKLSYITDTLAGGDTIQLSIEYGFDNQRRKSTLTQANQGAKTKYFFGNYEIITDDNGSKEFLFVNSPTGLCAIIESENVSGTRKQKVWHTYTDHLGSLIYAVNADSTAEKREYSYDAWGNLRHNTDWLDNDPDCELIADRGYTGHEHLTEFGLINMNGRVYDPVIGRFLSPDPFVQVPGQVDGYNRYAYCLNNPLRYVDPSGYIFERERSWEMWGIKPQQDSGGHGKTGGGTTMGTSVSSSGWSNSGGGSGNGRYFWGGGNHYYDRNGNSVTWQEAIEGTYQYLYGTSFFDNLNYADRETRKAKRLKISISGALATGRGSLTQRWQFGHPHIDISWVTVNVATNGGDGMIINHETQAYANLTDAERALVKRHPGPAASVHYNMGQAFDV